MMNDGVPETDRDDRLLRGGSFLDNRGRNLRSANRNRNRPENRNENIGFRCVRAPRRHHATDQVPCRVRRDLAIPHPDDARSSRLRADRPGVFSSSPLSSPPFFKGGPGGISDVGTPPRQKISPNPPSRKGGTIPEKPIPQLGNGVRKRRKQGVSRTMWNHA